MKRTVSLCQKGENVQSDPLLPTLLASCPVAGVPPA